MTAISLMAAFKGVGYFVKWMLLRRCIDLLCFKIYWNNICFKIYSNKIGVDIGANPLQDHELIIYQQN